MTTIKDTEPVSFASPGITQWIHMQFQFEDTLHMIFRIRNINEMCHSRENQYSIWLQLQLKWHHLGSCSYP